jgi:hypothetical protein
VELTTDLEEQNVIRFTVNGFAFYVPPGMSSMFISRLLEATKHAG